MIPRYLHMEMTGIDFGLLPSDLKALGDDMDLVGKAYYEEKGMTCTVQSYSLKWSTEVYRAIRRIQPLVKSINESGLPFKVRMVLSDCIDKIDAANCEYADEYFKVGKAESVVSLVYPKFTVEVRKKCEI